MKSIKSLSKRALLVICDGMGESSNEERNAVKSANTPTLDKLKTQFPFTTIEAGGELVGLPSGVAGNSEVGHLNLGAGRSIRQDLVRINEAIENDTLAEQEKFQELITRTKTGSKRLHLMGLLSDGGVHSHIDHLKAILKILRSHSEIEVFLHCFMDGRDTAFDSGIKYLKEIQKEAGFTIASMHGRSIAMDRDRRWEKIEKSYRVLVGKESAIDQGPKDYLQKQYSQEIYDEFIEPALFLSEGAIQSEDTVFFFNFRPDRAKQISEAFCSDHFEHFKNDIRPSYFLCMSPYIDEEFPNVPILFDKEKVKGGVIEYLSGLGKKTFKIAETEKYAHVTYFFNGGEEKPFPGEERTLIDSPREVKTYNEKPEMSAYEVCEALESKLRDQETTLCVVNFANPDMVGHTGDFPAAIKAMEVVDECISRLQKVCEAEKITMLVTADHGNCDEMSYDDGSRNTSHSKAKVPCILYHKDLEGVALSLSPGDRSLQDVAPTLLTIVGIDIPAQMTGKSIFE